MQELVEWTNAALDARELHPLFIIGMFTVSILAIHPFQDGNGRLSRILTTLLLLRCGYAYTPYSSLKALSKTAKRAIISPCDKHRRASERIRQTGSLGCFSSSGPCTSR